MSSLTLKLALTSSSRERACISFNSAFRFSAIRSWMLRELSAIRCPLSTCSFNWRIYLFDFSMLTLRLFMTASWSCSTLLERLIKCSSATEYRFLPCVSSSRLCFWSFFTFCISYSSSFWSFIFSSISPSKSCSNYAVKVVLPPTTRSFFSWVIWRFSFVAMILTYSSSSLWCDFSFMFWSFNTSSLSGK